MNILEKEIEDLLFNTLTVAGGNDLLTKRGLHVKESAVYVRQPDLGNYGRPDIVGFTITPKVDGWREIRVVVFELKKEHITIGTLLQACRYTKGIHKYIENLGVKKFTLDFHVILIGKLLDNKNEWVYTFPFLKDISIYTFSISLDLGLEFEQHGEYYLSNPKFPDKVFQYQKVKNYLDSSLLLIEEQEKENPF